MLTLYRELVSLYPDAEITVGITNGSGCASADGADDMDHEMFSKVVEEHSGWI
jgi:hypothetical protein